MSIPQVDYYMGGGEAPTVSTHTVFYRGCSLFPRRASFLSSLKLAVRESSTVHPCRSNVSDTTPLRGVEGASPASPILLGTNFVARYILKDDVISSSCGDDLFCVTESASQLVLRVWSPHVLNHASICDPIVSNATASICCRIVPEGKQRHLGHRLVIIWGMNISGTFWWICPKQTNDSNNPPGATCMQCFGMASQRHVVILPVSSLGISVCFRYGSRGYSSTHCIVLARRCFRSHRGSSRKAFNQSPGKAGSKARACTFAWRSPLTAHPRTPGTLPGAA